MPNGKPSAALTQSTDETETTNANAATRTADVTELMQSLETFRASFYWTRAPLNRHDREKPSHKKIPAAP
jgi:hypothetical protein